MDNLIRRIFILLMVSPLVFAAKAQDDIEITVDAPGTLAEQLLLISPNAMNETVKLKVNGYIDGNDMMFIRELCGVKDISTPTEGRLTQLDLSEAFVVSSDKPYISLYGIDFTTENDVFGCCFLYNCRQLKQLQLPNTTLAVDSFALANCSGLESIELPSNLEIIGLGTFIGCDGLQTLTVPNTVDSIAEGAFQRMSRLRELTLGNGVTTIDNSLLLGDDSLQYINLGREFRSFHPVVFYTAPGLEEINVFYENPYLSSDDGVLFTHDMDTLMMFPPASRFSEYVIPDGVKRVARSAFYGAKNLTSVSMPESLTVIDSLAFFDCMALEQVEMGTGIDSIAFGAFGMTPNSEPGALTQLNLPASVSYIEGGAFFCHQGLKAVVVDSDNPVYASDENGFVYDKSLSKLVYAPASTETFELPPTVTAIGEFAATGVSGLTSLYVNDSVTEIGMGAFAYSTGPYQISFGKGIAKLGDILVQGCSNLNAVYFFADNLVDENIAEYAFFDEEGYVFTNCTLFVKPGFADLFLFKRGFYSEANEFFYFADIQEMEDADDIRSPKGDLLGGEQYYTLDGKQHPKMQRGLNIIRLPEGKSVKHLIR